MSFLSQTEKASRELIARSGHDKYQHHLIFRADYAYSIIQAGAITAITAGHLTRFYRVPPPRPPPEKPPPPPIELRPPPPAARLA